GVAPFFRAAVQLPAQDNFLVTLANHRVDSAAIADEGRVTIPNILLPGERWSLTGPVLNQVAGKRHPVPPRAAPLRPTGSAGRRLFLQKCGVLQFLEEGSILNGRLRCGEISLARRRVAPRSPAVHHLVPLIHQHAAEYHQYYAAEDE